MPAVKDSIRRARLDGIELPYVDTGEGEPVVFVHGSNSDHRIWDEHRAIIASRYRVIAIDQRYFGTDPWPDDGDGFRVQAHADDLAAFVQALGVGPVAIVGWSYGGAVCLTMAVQNPGLVGRMFLYEPALATFVVAPEEAEAALEDRLAMSRDAKPHADAGDFAAAVSLFMDGVNAEAGTFDRLLPNVQKMMIENARMLPLLFAGPPPPSVTAADLRNLKVPVALLLGKESRAFYRIAASAAQGLLASAEFQLVENAKHLWPIQDPTAFSQLVLNFLDDSD